MWSGINTSNLATMTCHREADNRLVTEQRNQNKFATHKDWDRVSVAFENAANESCLKGQTIGRSQQTKWQILIAKQKRAIAKTTTPVPISWSRLHESEFGPGLQTGSISRNTRLPALWTQPPPRPFVKFIGSPPSWWHVRAGEEPDSQSTALPFDDGLINFQPA